MRIHDELTVELTPTPINRKTSKNPTEILENYIETVTNDQDDENVYEIDPVITWETLQKYRETSDCELFNIIMDKFERILKKPFTRGFWDSKTLISKKLYMLILRIKLRFYTMESLYRIESNNFKRNYGQGLLTNYDNPVQVIISIFEKYKWVLPKFKYTKLIWTKTQEPKFLFEYYKNQLKDLYEKYGICALSYKWLRDNEYKDLYNNIVVGKTNVQGDYKITLECLAKEWGVYDDWKNQRHQLMGGRCGRRQVWTIETFQQKTEEIIQEHGFIPAGEYLRKNGYGGYVSYMYSQNIKMSDLQEQYKCKKTKWISKNNMYWASHAECCLANFLYGRGIQIKNGEKYPDDYSYITGRSYGRYDLHFKATLNNFEDKWIKVEVWGDKPNGHSEIEYALKRKQKEDFHKNDSLFLGISYKQCYIEDALQNILKKYIGIIKPYIFKDERDNFFKTTQWTLKDIVIKECKYIMKHNNNILPPEGWFRFRKGGKYENRKIENWEKNIKINLNTLTVYIEKVGGFPKIREILGSSKQ